MSLRSTVVSSADLLRALKLAEQDSAASNRFAELLKFYPQKITDSSTDVLINELGLTSSQPEKLFESKNASAIKEPLRSRYFVITSCEPIEELKNELRPLTTKKGLTKEQCLPRRRSGSPPMPLLVRRQRLWPAVKRSLAITRQSGVDITKLSAQIARSEPVMRIPSIQRQWWGGELLVIWDHSERMAPYNKDYQTILDQLVINRGIAGLRLYSVDGLPGQVTDFFSPMSDVNPGMADILQFARGCTVLLLSDLGALSAVQSAARHWQEFARNLSHLGSHVTAWVPHSSRQVETETARLIKIYCLDRAGNLCAQSGSLRTEAQKQKEYQRLCELREQLLIRLSFCVRVEKEMLREFRGLQPATAVEPALEGLTWSYRPVVRASGISRPLSPAYQEAYRKRFSSLTAEEQCAALISSRHVHDWQGRSTSVLEALIWQSHARDGAGGDVVDGILKDAKDWVEAFRVNLALADHNAKDVAEFAEDVLSRNWHDETFQRSHSQWLAELWARTGCAKVPLGLHEADVLRVNSKTIDSDSAQSYQLMQIGSRLMLWPLILPIPSFTVSRLSSPWWLDGVEKRTASPPYRSWEMPKGQPTILLNLVREEVSCTLVVKGLRYSLNLLERPRWATTLGRDSYGTYAEFTLKTSSGITSQRLRWIEPGSFWMGSPEDESERANEEGPQHTVTLSQGFWLADTACTQGLWEAVMGSNPSKFKGDDQLPVESVSWFDVQEFLGKLEALLPGCRAGLPTEAEWEYACRAGTQTPFSFGEGISLDEVNYHGGFPYAGGEKGLYREWTVPVKNLPSNGWGLYQMHGNVWEWCEDELRSYDGEPQRDPVGQGGKSEEAPRAVRGGSWYDDARWARSAYRNAYQPGDASYYLGFRLCLRSIEPSVEKDRPGGTEG